MRAIIGPAANLDELRTLITDRMRADLYFTVKHIFEMTWFDSPFHQELATAMWREQDHPQLLILAPRGSGKSTIGMAKMAAKFLLNHNARQLLVSYDLRQSQKFLASIREELILKNRWTRFLFPAIYKAVSETEVRRDYHMYKELVTDSRPDPHFMAASLNSGITGMHVDIEVDDLIDETAARSDAECKRACDWVDTTFNVLTHQVRGIFHFRGTHYHLRDPYAYILEHYPNFATFIKPGLITLPDGSLASYWPSKYTVDDLLTMRTRNPYVFASQIQQEPIQHGDAPFRAEWLKYWDWEREGSSLRSPALPEPVNLSDLTIAVIYDPAIGTDSSRSDTAIIVVGMDAFSNFYVLETFARSCSPAEGVQKTISLAKKWEPDLVVVEEVLFSTLLVPLLESKARGSRLASYNITPIAPEGRSKAVRIASLQALFEDGRIYLHRSQDQLITQYLQYPYGRKLDLLDALAYAPRVLYPPYVVKRSSSGDERILNGAAPVTGY